MSEQSTPLLTRQFYQRIGLGLFLVSAATLTFEINLTRLFSVAQFYHFAFMIVGVALLGFGASGTALALLPSFSAKRAERSLPWFGLAAGLSILGAYLLTNEVPFDSFSIAWDRKQLFVLALHYIALALPFFFSGICVGLLLALFPEASGQTYAINLLGSAFGCLIALAAPSYLGGEGTLVLSSGLATTSAAAFAFSGSWENGDILLGRNDKTNPFRTYLQALFAILTTLSLGFSLVYLVLRASGRPGSSFLELRLSPYKGLSYAMQHPGAELIYTGWNAFSRVDLVRSSGIHSLPGLSYRYLKVPPPEDGLLVDGDDLSPVLLPGADLGFAEYLPAAIAFRLRSQADVLVLEPRGGLDVLTALSLSARHVTAVEVNPLIVQAARHIYTQPGVQVVIQSDRSYLRQMHSQADIILLSLANSYHPVRSGAYTLAEDYRYTVESFQDALARLKPEGILVVTRWVQSPPSESLRAFALAVTALENSGLDPKDRIVAFRSYTTATLLVKKNPFTLQELNAIRDFAGERAFDLIYLPGISADETNRYNILPEPVYHQAFVGLINSQPRKDFYNSYPFEVSPPTDDRPFFGHFFKWSQARQVWAELGKIWQPFGGAGYFVILALLILSIVLSGVLILLPAFAARWRSSDIDSKITGPSHSPVPYLIYFGAIGLAYLLVEIPLLQRFILYLDHPAYAITAVLFALLFFSGLGSIFFRHIRVQTSLTLLVITLIILPFVLPLFFSTTLGFPLEARLLLTGLVLAPVGFLMGMPFPSGIQWLIGKNGQSTQIPWIWAVNGSASVVSAVLAALFALSFGFSWVLRIGAICYLLALLTVIVAERFAGFRHP